MAATTTKKERLEIFGYGKYESKMKDDYFFSNKSELHPAQLKLLQLTDLRSDSINLSALDAVVLLCNMIEFAGAKRCIDVGVYTGYSSLSWALSIPEDGKVVACDISMEFAQVGIPVWKEAGVDGKIDLRIAPAVETLQALVDGGDSGTYDFVYIDADKLNYDKYYEFALKLLRPRGIIAIDNVFWQGQVLDPDNTSETTAMFKNLNKKIKSDPRVTAVMMDSGDGLYVCLKK